LEGEEQKGREKHKVHGGNHGEDENLVWCVQWKLFLKPLNTRCLLPFWPIN